MSNFATGLATANKLLYFFLFTTSCNARMIKSEQKAKEGMSGGEKRRKKKGGRIGYIHTYMHTNRIESTRIFRGSYFQLSRLSFF